MSGRVTRAALGGCVLAAMTLTAAAQYQPENSVIFVTDRLIDDGYLGVIPYGGQANGYGSDVVSMNYAKIGRRWTANMKGGACPPDIRVVAPNVVISKWAKICELYYDALVARYRPPADESADDRLRRSFRLGARPILVEPGAYAQLSERIIPAYRKTILFSAFDTGGGVCRRVYAFSG